MSKNPTYLNIKMHEDGDTATVGIETDAEHELALVPLLSLVMHSIISRTEITKDDLLEMLDDSIDKMEGIVLQ